MEGRASPDPIADRHRGYEVLTMTFETSREKQCATVRQTRRRSLGQSLAEISFITPVFVLLMVGMVEYGRVLMIQHVITNAAREGARLGVVFGSNEDTVRTTVNTFLQSGRLDLAKAQITIAGTNGTTGATSSVAVSYPYQSVVLRLIHYNSDTVTLSVTSRMVHE